MRIRETVGRLADMQMLLAYYGFRLDKNGFMCCPFHAEKTASFKLYANNRRWHCFGCGADGDAIDFVKRIENIDNDKATARVNEICCLGLPAEGDRPTLKQLRKIKEITEQVESERAALKAANDKMDELLTAYTTIDRIIMSAAPKTPEDNISDTYAEALKAEPYYNYLLDCGGSA